MGEVENANLRMGREGERKVVGGKMTQYELFMEMEELRSAAWNGRLEHVEWLLDELQICDDCDVNRFVDYALLDSAANGHIDIVQSMLKRGANIHSGEALCESAANNHLDIVALLLEKGADVHTRDDIALQWAAENGNVEIVELLIENGADVHVRNNDPLRSAAFEGHLKVVELLIEKSSSSTSSSSNSNDMFLTDDEALWSAAHRGHAEIARILTNHGARLHISCPKQPKVLTFDEQMLFLQTLLSLSSSPCSHQTIFFFACIHNYSSVVSTLLLQDQHSFIISQTHVHVEQISEQNRSRSRQQKQKQITETEADNRNKSRDRTNKST